MGRAQEKGLQLWQTRSHANILQDSVPTCIEKSGKPQRGQILYQRIPTPRPAPKIVLKDACQAFVEAHQARGDRSFIDSYVHGHSNNMDRNIATLEELDRSQGAVDLALGGSDVRKLPKGKGKDKRKKDHDID